MNFFKALQLKLSKKPSSDFDRVFHERFEKEFGKSLAKPSFFALPKIWIPSVVAAGLLLFTFAVQRPFESSNDFIAHEELVFLKDFEVLETLDEELLSMTDEEWNEFFQDEGTT